MSSVVDTTGDYLESLSKFDEFSGGKRTSKRGKSRKKMTGKRRKAKGKKGKKGRKTRTRRH